MNKAKHSPPPPLILWVWQCIPVAFSVNSCNVVSCWSCECRSCTSSCYLAVTEDFTVKAVSSLDLPSLGQKNIADNPLTDVQRSLDRGRVFFKDHELDWRLDSRSTHALAVKRQKQGSLLLSRSVWTMQILMKFKKELSRQHRRHSDWLMKTLGIHRVPRYRRLVYQLHQTYSMIVCDISLEHMSHSHLRRLRIFSFVYIFSLIYFNVTMKIEGTMYHYTVYQQSNSVLTINGGTHKHSEFYICRINQQMHSSDSLLVYSAPTVRRVHLLVYCVCVWHENARYKG
jgi:hypothetical protein